MKTVIVLLSLAFVYAPANQLAYIFTHPPSYDNGISYRGSFDHESNLGFLLVGMIPIILILKNITNNKIFKWLIFGLFLYLHIGIILNNYRTATLGLLVFWVIVFLYRFKSLSQVKKVGYISASFVFMLTAFVLFADRIADMFGDIYLIVSNPGLYFDFTGNAVPNKLMSGRIDIINTVMSVYIKSDIEQLLLGLGPSAINNIIGVYAHNEFISALVETGIIGFIVFSVVLITIIKRCNRVIKYDSIYALPAGSAVFAIIFMCLATMPFRNMRALMVVG
ncbi:MAG: O-antigen ligase family protein, partial [Candidatus Thiodiazotropha sp.]